MSLIAKTTASNDKTKQLVLYIADRMKDEKTYGATVLNKVLYYIDNVSYLENGKPISDFKYIKQGFGATPSPSQFLPLKRELIDENSATEKSFDYFGRLQKKFVATKPPDIHCFSAEEISLIERIIDLFKSVNASTVSNYNHQELCWRAAKNMEELPFFTYLLSKEPILDEDLQWAAPHIAAYNAIHNN